MGDNNTIRKIPLFGVLASTPGAAPVVLVVQYCSKNLLQGGKKDAKYVTRIFIPHMLTLDHTKNSFDLYIVGGASNI
jgi:hypothetical protein